MTTRPSVMGQNLVDRLRNHLSPAEPVGRRPTARLLGGRTVRAVGRSVRRATLRLVDPSLQATLDQLRRETTGGRTTPPELEVLRAELRTTHVALVELDRRLDKVERALEDAGLLPMRQPPFV